MVFLFSVKKPQHYSAFWQQTLPCCWG